MFLALGLVLSTVVGADDTPTTQQSTVPSLIPVGGPETSYLVQYESHVLTMPGLGWRQSVGDRLRLLTRLEGGTVWAVDEAAKAEVLRLAGGPEAPEPQLVWAELGQPVVIGDQPARRYIADMGPETPIDGEVRRAAYEPDEDKMLQRPSVLVRSSRMIGIGVQTDLRIEEHRLEVTCSTDKNLHVSEETRLIAPFDSPAEDARLLKSVGSGALQFPGVASIRVEGEWLIPSEGALVVSLGPVSDKADKTVGERLLLLSARLVPIDPVPVP